MNRITMTCAGIFFWATAITAQNSLIIDNCDDGNNQSVSKGWWYTYDDSSTGGNSVVLPPHCCFQMGKPGFGNKGHAANMKGTTGNKLGWDFIGLGVTMSEASGCPDSKPVDLRKYTNLQFKIRGTFSGGRLVVKFPYTENSCESGQDQQQTLIEWADYEAPLTGKIKPEWVTISLNLRKDFHQPKWTKQNCIVPMEEVLKNIKNLNFHYSSSDGDSIDLWIDDIEFTK